MRVTIELTDEQLNSIIAQHLSIGYNRPQPNNASKKETVFLELKRLLETKAPGSDITYRNMEHYLVSRKVDHVPADLSNVIISRLLKLKYLKKGDMKAHYIVCGK